MRLVDLSIALENGVPADPPNQPVALTYRTHSETASELAAFFPGLRAEDLPDGEGWAVEHASISTHNGTHMDAPWHYHSTMDGGVPAMTIDAVPLEWCFQPGVKLDLRHLPDGAVATPGDLDAALAATGHALAPLEIVLINTGAGARFGWDDYIHSGCGVGREATLHLLRQGIKVVGTDGWSWDAPFSHTARRWERDRDPSVIWEGHRVGRQVGYCQLEKLHDLDTLPGDGFTVSCFPVKVARASAGWSRVVAILP